MYNPQKVTLYWPDGNKKKVLVYFFKKTTPALGVYLVSRGLYKHIGNGHEEHPDYNNHLCITQNVAPCEI